MDFASDNFLHKEKGDLKGVAYWTGPVVTINSQQII